MQAQQPPFFVGNCCRAIHKFDGANSVSSRTVALHHAAKSHLDVAKFEFQQPERCLTLARTFSLKCFQRRACFWPHLVLIKRSLDGISATKKAALLSCRFILFSAPV